jgi:nucleoside-diphosphate-sugar epimerase
MGNRIPPFSVGRQEMKTSLVAGAAGFLGSNLCQALLELGHQVIGVDNFSTSNRRNLEALIGNSNFDFYELSILDTEYLEKIANLDFVFHFASPASPAKYQAQGLETIKANTVGTENLIRLALRHSAKFVFSSTSEVYGDPLVSPQKESYWGNVNPIGPRSVYDESKRLGETLVSHFVQNQGLKGSIVRIFNTYGPGMDPFDGRVVSTFIRQALNSEPFSIFGLGTQTRSFCFVDDLILGIVKCANSEQFGPVNLGNPKEINLIELGEIIASTLGVQPTFEHFPLPEDDPMQRRPDISRAKSLLDWEPTVTLEEGIRRTALWMRELEGIG